MDLQIGNSYKLQIKIGDKILTFTCEIIKIDADFITFKDKFGEVHSYHRSTIMSYTGVSNGN